MKPPNRGFFVADDVRPFILTIYFSIKYHQYYFEISCKLLSFTIFAMVVLWLT